MQDKPVTNGIIAGSIVTMFVWMLKDFCAVVMPTEVAQALTVLVMVCVTWVEHRAIGKRIDVLRESNQILRQRSDATQREKKERESGDLRTRAGDPPVDYVKEAP